MNKVFQDFHRPSDLSKDTWIFKKVSKIMLEKLSEQNIVPEVVMMCLVRTKTYIKLRELNKIISDVKNKNSKKL